jgi:hypothetical protein
MIKKQNILELFGGDSRMYHSVIITCYSFDFLFFEERVLPRLRGAGMININIFMDAGNYEKQVTDLESSQFRSKNAYSITPIKMPRAFHPKIIFGIGKDNGFLAIGSGNLTNSGLSSNDEIWGAFHTYKGEGYASPFFGTLYRYLMRLAPFCYGINKTKLESIYDNTHWLRGLISKENLASKISKNGNDITLLASLADNSILSGLRNHLPKNTPDRICVITPYYNNEGRILNIFQSELCPKRMDVVVDEKFGTVPYKMENIENIHFHCWSEVKITTGKESPRLHAKMFQFEYDSANFLLMGSANCSVEALGTLNSNGYNAEMTILMKSEAKTDWIKDLGIELPEKGNYQLAKYIPNPDIEPFTPQKRFEHSILHAELDMDQLYLNLSFGNYAEKIHSMVIVNRDGSSEKYPIDISNNFQTFALNSHDADHGYKVYLTDSIDAKISNVALIHNRQLLQNSILDSKYARFQEIISSERFADNDLLELLDYAQFINKTPKHFGVNHTTWKNGNDEEKDSSIKYGTVGESEFNKNEGISQNKSSTQTSLLNTLEDFLNNMVFGDNNDEDVSDSGERVASQNRDKGLQEDNNVNNVIQKMSYSDGKRLTGKLHAKLVELSSFISNKHTSILNSIVEMKPFSLEITIEDIQALLVGTHLLFMKMDETYIEERARIKIKYKSINDLTEWENESGIGLKRAESQNSSDFSEVTYTVDNSAIKVIEDRVNKYLGLTLTYYDETPSIVIPHYFYDSNPIVSNSKQCFTTIKGFLINIACPFLLVLNNGEEKYSPQEKIKFVMLKKRLFYRLLILTTNNSWRNDEYDLFYLLVLNLIHCLYPEDMNLDDIWKELDIQKDRIKTNSVVYSNNVTSIRRIMEDYLKWLEIYNNDKNKLFQDINTSKVGRIIFRKRIGFSFLSLIYKDTVNLSTPLGNYINEKGKFEISNLKVGSKAIFFSR